MPMGSAMSQHLRQMLVGFLAGLMNVFEWCARKLELTAGLR